MKRAAIRLVSIILLAATLTASLSGCFVSKLLNNLHPYTLRLMCSLSDDVYEGYSSLFDRFSGDYDITDVTTSYSSAVRVLSKGGINAVILKDGTVVYSTVRDGYTYQVRETKGVLSGAVRQETDSGAGSLFDRFDVPCPITGGESGGGEEIVLSSDMIKIDSGAGEAYVADEGLLTKLAEQAIGELPDCYKRSETFFEDLVKRISYNKEEDCTTIYFATDQKLPEVLIEVKSYGYPETRVETRTRRPAAADEVQYMIVESSATVENIEYDGKKVIAADIEIVTESEFLGYAARDRYTAKFDVGDESNIDIRITDRVSRKLPGSNSDYKVIQDAELNCKSKDGAIEFFCAVEYRNGGTVPSGRSVTKGIIVFNAEDCSVPAEYIERAVENCIKNAT